VRVSEWDVDENSVKMERDEKKRKDTYLGPVVVLMTLGSLG